MSEYNFIDVLIVATLTAQVWLHFIFNQPRLFFAAYIILSTRMFGFMPMSLSLRVNAIMFFLHCAMILAVVALLLKGRKFSSRMIVLFLAGVSVLIAFGIIYPYCVGFSNIRSAIVDGKDMFGYAALAYLAIHFRRFDFDYFLKLFCFVGVVLAAVLIVGHISGYYPPGYTRVEGTRIIHVSHNTYISLASCLIASQMLKPRSSVHSAFLFLFLITGLFLQGHRSVVLTTFFAIFLLWLVRAHSSVKLYFIIIGLPLLLAFHLVSDGRYFETIVVEPISELLDSSYGAIASRKRINAVRSIYIEQRPLLGYGFIDETSSLGWSIDKQSVNRFDQSLGVVDSGYLDMSVRFGIVGTLFFCFVFGFVLLQRLRNVRSLGNGQLAMALFLSTYFLMNYTWSVFTYGFGISCACVALFLLYSKESGDMMSVCANRSPRDRTIVIS